MTLAGSVSVSESSLSLTVVFDKISTLPRDVGSSIYSDGVMTQHGTRLYVQIFIGGNKVETKDHCSIILNSTDAVKLSYSMKLVNHIDDKKSIIETINSYEFEAGEGYGWNSFTKTEHLLDPKHGFLVQDAITIFLQLKVEGKQRLYDYRENIMNDMIALLFDKSTTDYFVTIVKDNDESMSTSSTPSPRKRNLETFMIDASYRIPVHKLILQVRSPVFKAMLSSTMKESTSNEIIISDFDHNVVKEFMRLECMRKIVFALSICAFKFTVSKNKNVYAQTYCCFIYAASLSYEAISMKLHQCGLISHFSVKNRALEGRGM